MSSTDVEPRLLDDDAAAAVLGDRPPLLLVRVDVQRTLLVPAAVARPVDASRLEETSGG